MTTNGSELQDEFLKDHRLGILATGRGDGSPQQSLIAFNYDGIDIVISTGAQSAKAKNLRRGSRASLAVSDGPKVVVVYGETRIATGAETKGLEDRLEWLRAAASAPASGRTRPDLGERVMLVMTPAKVFSARPHG